MEERIVRKFTMAEVAQALLSKFPGDGPDPTRVRLVVADMRLTTIDKDDEFHLIMGGHATCDDRRLQITIEKTNESA